MDEKQHSGGNSVPWAMAELERKNLIFPPMGASNMKKLKAQFSRLNWNAQANVVGSPARVLFDGSRSASPSP